MYDGPECYVVAEPRAKKFHRCCECGGGIQIGETYEKTFGIWDGDPLQFKTCLGCVEIREALAAGSPDGQWYYGNLAEEVEESGDIELQIRFKTNREKRRRILAISADNAIVTYA